MSSSSKEAILAAARRTAQAHGYGGLNFRDLADEVGIKATIISRARLIFARPSEALTDIPLLPVGEGSPPRRGRRTPAPVPLLRRRHAHHRDIPARRLAARKAAASAAMKLQRFCRAGEPRDDVAATFFPSASKTVPYHMIRAVCGASGRWVAYGSN